VSDSPARLNPDGTDQDDWDDHWDKYGEAAKGNPANDYRHAMVLKLLVHAQESHPRLGQTVEVGKVASVGQDINIRDVSRLVMFQNVANKVAANETAAARH